MEGGKDGENAMKMYNERIFKRENIYETMGKIVQKVFRFRNKVEQDFFAFVTNDERIFENVTVLVESTKCIHEDSYKTNLFVFLDLLSQQVSSYAHTILTRVICVTTHSIIVTVYNIIQRE